MAGVSKLYRPWNPTQSFLLPPSPLQWLPEKHLAYFILDVVNALDLTVIEEAIEKKDARGERPYAPRMLLSLMVYGYCVGIFSSRKLAKATYDDVAFRVLSGGEHPYFTTINAFRLEHREAMASLFVQVLRLCQKAGLVKLGHVSLDGTKIAANASKHKAMSYERMQKEEARLQGEVEALLKKADQADDSDNERLGTKDNEEDVPKELERRNERLARIQKAKAELEQEAAECRAAQLRQAADEQAQKSQDATVPETERKRATTRANNSRKKADDLDSDDDDDNSGMATAVSLPAHRVATKVDGTPAPKAQRNFTDPDSRIMMSHGGFIQGFNAQAVVDSQAQIIVAEAVTNQAPDAEHLPAMLERIEKNLGQQAEKMSADAGYFSEKNVEAAKQHGVDAFIAVGRKKHGELHKSRDSAPSVTATTPKELMAQKLATDEGAEIYSRRKVIVEPPFGQIKSARGFRRFSLRGLGKVRNEWSLVCMTHNLLKLFRSGQAVLTPA
jgi:transposase/IS5 family transposase